MANKLWEFHDKELIINEKNMIIHQSLLHLKEDSFWYSGLIAEIGKYRLYAEGDICVEFPDGTYKKDNEAVEYAEELGYIDNNLQNVNWINNNWFEVGWVEGNCIEFDCGVVEHDYISAIELLYSYYKGKEE